MLKQKSFFLFIIIFLGYSAIAQPPGISWSPDGKGYTSYKDGNLIKTDPKDDDQTILFSKEMLTPAGAASALRPQSISYSTDGKYALLFTNTAKVWRYRTRGDYWLMDIASKKLTAAGKGFAFAIL